MSLPLYALDIDESLEGDGFVFAVGLVDQPAIERNWMAFAAQKQKFTVFNEEQRILAGPLMAADQPIYRRDPDGREYYVSFPAKSIAKIVSKYSKSGKTLSFNLDHNDAAPVKSCYLQQHFIINPDLGINTPKGFAELPAGSWFGFVKVDDPAEWEEAKKRGGFSVEGYFDEIKIAEADQQVYENLKNQLNKMSKDKTAFEKLMKLFEAKKKEFEGEDPIELATTALADGSGSIKGALEEGSHVMMVAADGSEMPVPDGEYVLEGGKKIKCEGGMVTDVSEEEAPAAMDETAVLQAIQTALDKQAAEFKAQIKTLTDAHAAQMKEVNDKFKSTFEMVEALAAIHKEEEPAADPKRKSLVNNQQNFSRFQAALSKVKTA